MKQVSGILALSLVLGMVSVAPAYVLAQTEEKAVQGSALGVVAPAASDDATVLNQAADALEIINPTLSSSLRAWAKGEGTGDKNATLTEASVALGVTNPELAAKVKAMVKPAEAKA